MTTDNLTRAELFPAYLYIAPGGLSEEETVNEKYYAGPTVGAIEICIRENIHNVHDMYGHTVCDIHYGGRLEIRGKLASVSPRALALILGAKDAGNGHLKISEAPSVRRLSVCVVSPIRGDSGTFSLFLRTATDSGSRLSLNSAERDAIDFTITSENNYGRTSALLSLGSFTEVVGA